jgi:hypothetical protein
MTIKSIEELWKLEQYIRSAEYDFWQTAEMMVSEGLVAVEDVAAIYGIHPQTASKRLKDWRSRLVFGKPDPARGLESD